MSIQALNWAFNLPLKNPSMKLVLISLANYADEDWECWPSQAEISRITDLCERAVRSNIAALIEQKQIASRREMDKSGRYTRNVYTLNTQRQQMPLPPSGKPGTQRQQMPVVKKPTRGTSCRSPEAFGAENQRHLVPVHQSIPSLIPHDEPSVELQASSSPSAAPGPTPGSDDDSFRKAVSALVETLPLPKPVKVTKSDVAELRAIGADLTTVEAALWVTLARRNGSREPIASFRYFLPAVREFQKDPQPAGYVQFTKEKVIAAVVDKSLGSSTPEEP